jgi:hypothetical protein
MRVAVNVDREQAILAGQDGYGRVVVELDPAELSEEDRAMLAATPELNGITDLTANPWRSSAEAPKRPRTATPDPLAWLAWRRAMQAFEKDSQAREALQVEQELAAYLDWARAQPVEAFLEWTTGGRERVRLPMPSKEAPRLPSKPYWLDWSRAPEVRAREALAETWAAAEQLAATREAERQARRAAEEAEQEAKAVRRQEQLAAWVGSVMDENAQGRFQRGVLAESEILEAIAEDTFAPLAEFPRYVPIQCGDLDHADACEECEMECRLGPANSLGVALTADQYAVFLAIERAAIEDPAGLGATRVEVTPYAQVCACSDCDAELSRVAARVTVRYGELAVSRAYGLDGDAAESRQGELTL